MWVMAYHLSGEKMSKMQLTTNVEFSVILIPYIQFLNPWNMWKRFRDSCTIAIYTNMAMYEMYMGRSLHIYVT